MDTLDTLDKIDIRDQHWGIHDWSGRIDALLEKEGGGPALFILEEHESLV